MRRALIVVLGAEAIANLGGQVTLVALPLTAIVTLNASALDIGVMQGLISAPAIFTGLIAGRLIDHLPGAGLLAVSNILGAMALALIPLLHKLNVLSMWSLTLGGVVARAATDTVAIGLMTLMPRLVPEADLAAANGQLSVVGSIARVCGPAVAGMLVVIASPPTALGADALSLLVAALMLASLTGQRRWSSSKAKARSPADLLGPTSLPPLSFIWDNPTMRIMTALATALNFVGAVYSAVIAVRVVRDLDVPPGAFAGLLTAGGIGAALGALGCVRLLRGGSIITLSLAVGCIMSIVPAGASLLGGQRVSIEVGFCLLNFLENFATAAFNVAFMTFVQREAPPDSLGRVSGVLFALVSCAAPFGALIGGGLAGEVGTRTTLLVAAGLALGVTAATFLLSRVQSPPKGQQRRPSRGQPMEEEVDGSSSPSLTQ